MSGEKDYISEAELRAIIEETATSVVKKHATMIGIPSDPLKAQEERLALREVGALLRDPEFQQDLIHLRKWRKTMDSVQSKGFIAALGFVCLAGLSLILYVVGIKFPNP